VFRLGRKLATVALDGKGTAFVQRILDPEEDFPRLVHPDQTYTSVGLHQAFRVMRVPDLEAYHVHGAGPGAQEETDDVGTAHVEGPVEGLLAGVDQLQEVFAMALGWVDFDGVGAKQGAAEASR
jgi:hypothetical protein